jgi:hypothetical protein
MYALIIVRKEKEKNQKNIFLSRKKMRFFSAHTIKVRKEERKCKSGQKYK